MVAITVILAAVIGAFVLEIGDQQETAPNTSFDSDQAETYLEGASQTSTAKVTKVTISHAGGDVIDINNVELVVEGNESVWTDNEYLNGVGTRLLVLPNPDFTRTLGTNEQVTFGSGQTWGAVTYGGANDAWYSPLWKDQSVKKPNPSSGQYYYAMLSSGGIDDGYFIIQPNNIDLPAPIADNGKPKSIVAGRQLESGDQVNAVWEADSGGKTQTLFKYSVQ